MSYNKQLQILIEEYRRDVGDGALQIPEIAAWMIREGKWKPSMQEAMALLSRDLSDAMRTQYATDPDGRRVRRKHAVRMKDTSADGSKKQLVFWYDIDLAPPDFMQRSVQQRREGIADDCWQLKQDVDSYNKFYNKAKSIQLLLDFTEDMEEREQSEDYQPPDDNV